MADFYDPVRHLGSPINHQRMYDFERDILRVKNPLNEDFTFTYDSIPWTVVAGGTKDMERYLVRRYIWNMIGHIYQQFADETMQKAEAAFRKNHPDVMDDPYLINTQIYDKMKRADDPKFQEQVIKDCIVGVVSKFGTNRMVPKHQAGGKLDPNTPLFQTLIDGFKMVGVNDPAPAVTPSEAKPASASEVLLG